MLSVPTELQGLWHTIVLAETERQPARSRLSHDASKQSPLYACRSSRSCLVLGCRVTLLFNRAVGVCIHSTDAVRTYAVESICARDRQQGSASVLFAGPPIPSKGQKLMNVVQCEASQALTVLGHDPSHLGKYLMRMALSGNTSSSSAVLQALLALSSLHRYGVQSQAVELKISSIRSLAVASQENFGAKEVIQHIAAGMLLCSFEVHQSSCTSSQWLWYVAGIKQVLKAFCIKNFDHGELSKLMDWIYYHDVLARFTLRHWNQDARRLGSAFVHLCKNGCKQYEPFSLHSPGIPRHKYAPSPTAALLDLLSEVCDTVIASPHLYMSVEELNEYTDFIKILDWRIRNHPSLVSGNDLSESKTVIDLYHLAILVYLNRASEVLPDLSTKLEDDIERSFDLLSRLEVFERHFPIFILGCEAQTDERRLVILNLIARTEKVISSRSLNHILIMLRAIWTQDDLAESELNYCDKLSSIISRCEIVPSLV